jgi:hypothetical protein
MVYSVQGNTIRYSPREETVEDWEQNAYIPDMKAAIATVPALVVNFNAITAISSETNRALEGDMILMSFAIIAMIVFTALVLGRYDVMFGCGDIENMCS